MAAVYDEYYEQERYFGEPIPELVDYINTFPKNFRVLDIGCGQGRNALALGRLGFQVFGFDISQVGIQQMIRTAKEEGLSVDGDVADMFQFEYYHDFDVIVLDSMFHFYKGDRESEMNYIQLLIQKIKPDTTLVFAMTETKKSMAGLNESLQLASNMEVIHEQKVKYILTDPETGQEHVSPYVLLAARKR